MNLERPLIPILGAIIRTRSRKEKDKSKIDGWYKKAYNEKMPWENDMREMHVWIDAFTKGRFFLDLDTVAFEKEEDFVIFALWYKK